MKAILYARVSSDRQEREGFSIPAQVELLRDYAKKNHIEVVQEFIEAETAGKQGRNHFNEMLKLCTAKGGPKSILVEKTDRLYRNFKDALKVRDAMQDHGVAVHLVKEGTILDRDTTGQTKLVHNIYISIAENYIDNLREETKKGLRQRAKSGLWSRLAPFGYRNNKLTKTIHPCPNQAPLVKAAYCHYATGLYSVERLRRYLREQGYTYAPSVPMVPFSEMHRILKNPVYIGKIPHDGELYDGQHEPLIETDLFYTVQRTLKTTRKPYEYGAKGFTYKGLLRCQDCGHLMTGEEKKRGTIVYYSCTKRDCTNYRKYINEKILDKTVEETLSLAKIPKSAEPLLKEAFQIINNSSKSTYSEEFARITRELKRQRTKLRKAAEHRIDGEIDKTLWLEIKAETEETIGSLEIQLGRLNKADTFCLDTISSLLELPHMLYSSWSSALIDEKINILNLAVSNFSAKEKEASLVLKEPLTLGPILAKNREKLHRLDLPRTLEAMIPSIVEMLGQVKRLVA